MTNNQLVRSVAQAAFKLMLQRGIYSGTDRGCAWRFDADEWLVLVTSPTGSKHSVKPAKAWL